ncbi:hypothetical protein LguiB_028815 [Lonicera macranthoides]
MKTLTLFMLLLLSQSVSGVQILSKSKIEKCEKKVSDSNNNNLNCTTKIVINMAVPSESSGREASIVAELVEVEENSTNNMRTLRIPPVITVNKSAAYALYELTYIRDVPYKPEELYVKTRKCEPDAGADVVQLRDDQGHIMEYTQPTCCPCGDQRRVPSSCGNFFDKLIKGKANTAHCLRFPGDWFHVFGIGQRSVGFSVRIEVKTGSKSSEVIVGPENRTAMSNDNFLQVNLVGDYVGYTNIPSFDNYYLVIPRQGIPGQPQDLGRNFTMWMLLERVRFTLDGLECNKIGVSYEAFNGQPDFCSAPFWSCLHNQLWNFWDNAGSHSFSIGITEVLNTNLLIELRADDIEYVYQRWVLSAILKDSDFTEVDRAECQFTTTATVLDNGSQIPFQPPKTSINGFFESIEIFWNNLLEGLADFITGKTCRFRLSLPVAVLLWLLHQKGVFDPLYDWWEDRSWSGEQRIGHIKRHGLHTDLPQIRYKRHHKHEARHHHKHDAKRKRRNIHNDQRYNHFERDSDYQYYLHHVHKGKHKHGRTRSSSIMQQIYLDRGEDDFVEHRRRKRETESAEGLRKISRHSDGNLEEYHKYRHAPLEETRYKVHPKQRV